MSRFEKSMVRLCSLGGGSTVPLDPCGTEPAVRSATNRLAITSNIILVTCDAVVIFKPLQILKQINNWINYVQQHVIYVLHNLHKEHIWYFFVNCTRHTGELRAGKECVQKNMFLTDRLIIFRIFLQILYFTFGFSNFILYIHTFYYL